MLAMACSFALLFREASSLARKAFPEIAQHLPRAVVPRRARDAAAGMRSRAAEIQAGDRRAVVRMTQHRARGPELVERKLAMENVAADKTKLALEILGRKRAVTNHARPKARRVRLDHFEDALHRLALARLPIGGGIEVLAEKARDVRAFRRKAIVERARDHHLDDRPARDALRPRIEVGAVH